MELNDLLIFSAAALLLAPLRHGRARGLALMTVSVAAIYWLQPASAIRHLDFWLPTATIGLSVLVYFATHSGKEEPGQDGATGAALAGIVALIGLMRYLGPACCLTATPPPQFIAILVVIAVIGLAAMAARRFFKPGWSHLLAALVAGVFIVLKSDPAAAAASRVLRGLSGQAVELAAAADIRWLGFSYVAFRLIHTLRDRVTGRLPEVNLGEFVTYVIFFPAYTAGPIDRVERFIKDLRQPFYLDSERLGNGLRRIAAGVFKKFVLADSLALIALSPQNAGQVGETGWAWVLLYAYSLRIYFDFAGYTDIAIGIGTLLGIDLPENFRRPYLQTNLINFWNNWHITLTQWFRAYFFNPVTRALRTAGRPLPAWAALLAGQFGTMVLIGLWHGITWNFVFWGLWHGAGLFVVNRWQAFTRGRIGLAERSQAAKRLASGVGVMLTFNFVSLGWLWFTLPRPEQSLDLLKLLFGMA